MTEPFVLKFCGKKSSDGLFCACNPGHEGRCSRGGWGRYPNSYEVRFWWPGEESTTNLDWRRPGSFINVEAEKVVDTAGVVEFIAGKEVTQPCP